MALNNQNFGIYQGNSKQLVFVVSDVVSLAGATIKWACSQYSTLSPVVIQKSTPTITISGNTFTVPLLPADTKGLQPGEYYHEARVVDTMGNAMTVATGKMILLPALIKE